MPGYEDFIMARDPLDDLNIETLREFLKFKNAYRECPLCGHHDWTISDDSRERILYLPSTNRAHGGTPMMPALAPALEMKGPPVVVWFPFFEALPITCGNCGTVQLLNPTWIRRWLQEERGVD